MSYLSTQELTEHTKHPCFQKQQCRWSSRPPARPDRPPARPEEPNKLCLQHSDTKTIDTQMSSALLSRASQILVSSQTQTHTRTLPHAHKRNASFRASLTHDTRRHIGGGGALTLQLLLCLPELLQLGEVLVEDEHLGEAERGHGGRRARITLCGRAAGCAGGGRSRARTSQH